ncbi:MAG: hypothetical protein GF344_16540, partial [Chitinivibrionales bacterium]|nr:hypothetical protein [Chitinivibrionales bacterium]MBD3358301.1 hypothetical protein [Chitinivibrionales bacterium]
MKPRRWVAVLAVVLCIIIIAFFGAIEVLERSGRIENALEAHLSPLVEGSFEVEKVKVGFFSFLLSNVHISIPLRAFTVKVRDIKVGLSFRRLLQTRGDISGGISTIILLNPKIDMTMNGASTPAAADDFSTSSHTPKKMTRLPMQDLLIRDGVVRVNTGRGVYTAAERLNGRLRESVDGVAFTMAGALGAHKRNLSLSGVLSNDDSRHRISLRLKRARISKPIKWDRFVVSGGVLDGACEILFRERLAVDDCDATGWITIGDGEVGIENVGPALDKFDLAVTLTETRALIDSITARLGDLPLRVEGGWDFSHRRKSRLKFSCQNVDPAMLLPPTARFFKEKLLGNGGVSVELVKDRGAGTIGIRMAATGFSLGGEAITRAEAKGIMKADTALFDTVTIGGDRLRLSGKGQVSWKNAPPSYHIWAKGYSKASVFIPGLDGDLGWAGSLGGEGRSIRFDGVLSGDTLRYHGLDLGGTRLAVRCDGGSLHARPIPGEEHRFELSGKVYDLFGAPRLSLSGSLEGQPVLDFLSDMPWGLGERLHTASLAVDVKGPVSSFGATGRIRFQGAEYGGGLNVRLGRRMGKEGIHWALADSGLAFRGVSF